jgi:hypothetical protein
MALACARMRRSCRSAGAQSSPPNASLWCAVAPLPPCPHYLTCLLQHLNWDCTPVICHSLPILFTRLHPERPALATRRRQLDEFHPTCPWVGGRTVCSKVIVNTCSGQPAAMYSVVATPSSRRVFLLPSHRWSSPHRRASKHSSYSPFTCLVSCLVSYRDRGPVFPRRQPPIHSILSCARLVLGRAVLFCCLCL